jgi:cation-transporting P-type ATPase 13A2
VVAYLQKNDYLVGMIGDGLNDIGALKKADFGFSICDSEMGMCSSFTTKEQNFFYVIELLSEGRRTASSIIHLFKYFSLYSFTQFSSVAILFCYGRGLSNFQYLIEDLFITTFLVLSMTLTKSSQNLSPHVPNLNIFCFDNLISFLGQAVIQFVGQFFMALLIREQSWFDPNKQIIDEKFGYCSQCADSNAIYLYTLPLFINGLITTGDFYPNRQPFYKNFLLVFLWISLNIYSNLIILYEPSRLRILDLQDGMIKQEFLYAICGGAWFTVVLLWLWEKIICKKAKEFYNFKFRERKEETAEDDLYL